MAPSSRNQRRKSTSLLWRKSNTALSGDFPFLFLFYLFNKGVLIAYCCCWKLPGAQGLESTPSPAGQSPGRCAWFLAAGPLRLKSGASWLHCSLKAPRFLPASPCYCRTQLLETMRLRSSYPCWLSVRAALSPETSLILYHVPSSKQGSRQCLILGISWTSVPVLQPRWIVVREDGFWELGRIYGLSSPLSFWPLQNESFSCSVLSDALQPHGL